MLNEAVILGKICNPQAIQLENSVKDAEGFGLPSFSFDIIAAATNNFHENNKIGEGGYGPVFKVILHSLIGRQLKLDKMQQTIHAFYMFCFSFHMSAR